MNQQSYPEIYNEILTDIPVATAGKKLYDYLKNQEHLIWCQSRNCPSFPSVIRVTADYGDEGQKLNLSKASLTRFCSGLRKAEAVISSISVFNRLYDKSYIQAVLFIAENKISIFEEETGIKLSKMPQLQPGSDPF